MLKVLADLDLLDDDGEGQSAAPRVPIVEVWNKLDLLPADRVAELRAQAETAGEGAILPVSALTGEGCADLLAAAGHLLTADARELGHRTTGGRTASGLPGYTPMVKCWKTPAWNVMANRRGGCGCGSRHAN